MNEGNADISARVLKILRRALPRKVARMELLPEQRLRDDLQLDSMSLMTIAFRMEEEFGIDVAGHAESLARIQTVRDTISFIERVLHG